MEISEHRFLTVARKYGDWPKVLDPIFSPPEQFYVDLEAAGFSREEFARLRTRQSFPERETWLKIIAISLYWAWRHKLDYLDRQYFLKLAPGFGNGIRWQDVNAFLAVASVNFAVGSGFFEQYFDAMERLSITEEDVVRRITEDSDLFPPLVAPPEV